MNFSKKIQVLSGDVVNMEDYRKAHQPKDDHPDIDVKKMSQDDRRKLQDFDQKLLQSPLSQRKAILEKRGKFLEKMQQKYAG
jgi:hypothetical protein